MARGKNSPALFEVIRNAQQKQKEQLERQRQQQIAADLNAVSPAAALLRSPMYWFKGKHAHEASIEMPPAETAAEARPAEKRAAEVRPVDRRADLPVMKSVPPAPVEAARPVVETPRPVTAPVVPAPVAPAPAYVPSALSPAAEAARQVREEISAQEAPAFEPMLATPDYHSPFDADPDAEADDGAASPQINLTFNYTTAIVACFAIVVAFTVAYIIGTAGRSPKMATAKAAVRPDVLDVRGNDVPRDTTRADANKPAIAQTDAPLADDDSRASLANSADLALDTLGKPIPVPTNVKRVIGYQYLVLLSFPRDEDAKELVKFLAQNGVPATAEKALPGYAKTWTSVVTTRGFDHTKKNPAFDAYSAALTGLLPKYAGDSKFRKTFKIDVYTWRAAR